MKKLMLSTVCAAFLLSSCDTYTGTGAYAGGTLGSILGSAIGGISGGPRGSDVGTIVGPSSAVLSGLKPMRKGKMICTNTGAIKKNGHTNGGNDSMTDKRNRYMEPMPERKN